MRYLYYPGCSAEATGKAYDISTRALMAKLGVELRELDDWNCCGATSYFSVRELDSSPSPPATWRSPRSRATKT